MFRPILLACLGGPRTIVPIGRTPQTAMSDLYPASRSWLSQSLRERNCWTRNAPREGRILGEAFDALEDLALLGLRSVAARAVSIWSCHYRHTHSFVPFRKLTTCSVVSSRDMPRGHGLCKSFHERRLMSEPQPQRWLGDMDQWRGLWHLGQPQSSKQAMKLVTNNCAGSQLLVRRIYTAAEFVDALW